MLEPLTAELRDALIPPLDDKYIFMLTVKDETIKAVI